MRGKIFRQKGFSLSKSRSTRSQQPTLTIGSGFSNYLAGAVTHRPLQPDLMPNFERFRISGKGMSMNAANASILSSMARIKNATKKKSSKKSSGKKGNFKSLKFNF
jgi:hypothetical protein